MCVWQVKRVYDRSKMKKMFIYVMAVTLAFYKATIHTYIPSTRKKQGKEREKKKIPLL